MATGPTPGKPSVDSAARRPHRPANRKRIEGFVMSVADRIREKLASGLKPLRLEITDDSHLHAGHAGAREGGESHFTVEIVSEAFEGVGRVQRQRMIYGLLAEELAGPVHALALKTIAPSEDAA
jgi:BolA protein